MRRAPAWGWRLRRARREIRRFAGRAAAPARRGLHHLLAFAPLSDRLLLSISALGSRLTRSRRRADLRAALAGLAAAPVDARMVSVIVVGDGPLPAGLKDSGVVTEVIVVRHQPVVSVIGVDQVVAWPAGASVVDAASAGAAVAKGSLLCWLLPSTSPVSPGWLARLAAPVDGEVVATAPFLAHPARGILRGTPHDLRTRSLGFALVALDDDVAAIEARLAGAVPDLGGGPVEVFAAGGVGLLVDRCSFVAIGGFGPIEDLDSAAVDLCWRLRAAGGQILAVPGAVLFDGRPVASRRELAAPIDADGAGWRAVVDRHGPALRHEARRLRTTTSEAIDVVQNGLRIVLTVASPSAKVAPKWGDWHLAHDLARSLQRLGHDVRVSTADLADTPGVRSADVHVVVRGIAPIRRTSGQHHVIWIISHPEEISDAECDAADLVLVASARFAAALADRTTTPVEVLLQATDGERFHPGRADHGYAHPITVVAKTRDVLRPVVADAVAAGLQPAIYGSGWEAFGLGHLVQSDHLPNADLPAAYASAGVVLNDHWSTMAGWGFLSNRLFDVLACGTPVISDYLPEIADVFGDTVQTYRSPEELRELVEAARANPIAARERADRGRKLVLSAHTFEHRAAELLAALTRAGLDRWPR